MHNFFPWISLAIHCSVISFAGLSHIHVNKTSRKLQNPDHLAHNLWHVTDTLLMGCQYHTLFNTLRCCGCHLTGIFQCNSLNGNCCILVRNSLNLISRVQLTICQHKLRYGSRIPIIKMKRSHHRLIYVMEIPISGKTVFIIRRGPGIKLSRINSFSVDSLRKTGSFTFFNVRLGKFVNQHRVAGDKHLPRKLLYYITIPWMYALIKTNRRVQAVLYSYHINSILRKAKYQILLTTWKLSNFILKFFKKYFMV